MTLAVLLEELRGEDDTTWGDIQNYIEKVYDDVNPFVAYGEPPMLLDIIQASIQRACERREWHWLVCMDCWREGEYRAEMSIISESCISDMVEITTIAMKWGDSATEALLAAYIAAVRGGANR